MSGSPSRPSVEIDLDAVLANYRAVRAAASGAEASGVVKCNAYGLGAAEIAPKLAEDDGCCTFFVAYAQEGAELRKILKRSAPSAAIYVFNGPHRETLALFEEARLRPVLNSLSQAQAWSAQRRSEPAALHIDTGMNRLGAPISEIGAIKALSVNFDLVMSHLACASEPDHPMNARQRALFEEVARAFPNARRSLSASGGALMADAYHYDLVRPGIALYGASPFDDGPDPRLRPVARLTAPVVQLRRVATGETAGYGATRRFEKDALLATVALGYGDGLPRNASNRGAAYLGGAVCPIAGRVSMDLTILDASNAPRPIEIGDRAEFFGPAFAIEDAARHAGVSVYELLTGLGARLDRRYLSGVSHERRRDGGKVQ